MQSFIARTESVGKAAKKGLTIATVIIFAGMTFLPALQIVLRFVGMPFIGAEELTRFFLICMTFLSYPLVVAAKQNILMGEFKAALPSPIRGALDIITDFLTLALSVFIAYATCYTVLGNLKNVTPTLAIPFWIFLASTFIAFACSGVIHLTHLLTKLSGGQRLDGGEDGIYKI